MPAPQEVGVVCSGDGVLAPRGSVPRGCLFPGGAGIPACTEADPRERRLLLRTVRILLECILVASNITTLSIYSAFHFTQTVSRRPRVVSSAICFIYPFRSKIPLETLFNKIVLCWHSLAFPFSHTNTEYLYPFQFPMYTYSKFLEARARSNFHHVMQFACKFWPNNRLTPPFGLAPPSGKSWIRH